MLFLLHAWAGTKQHPTPDVPTTGTYPSSFQFVFLNYENADSSKTVYLPLWSNSTKTHFTYVCFHLTLQCICLQTLPDLASLDKIFLYFIMLNPPRSLIIGFSQYLRYGKQEYSFTRDMTYIHLPLRRN